MKTLLTLCLAFLLAVSFVSCDKDDDVDEQVPNKDYNIVYDILETQTKDNLYVYCELYDILDSYDIKTCDTIGYVYFESYNRYYYVWYMYETFYKKDSDIVIKNENHIVIDIYEDYYSYLDYEYIIRYEASDTLFNFNNWIK